MTFIKTKITTLHNESQQTQLYNEFLLFKLHNQQHVKHIVPIKAYEIDSILSLYLSLLFIFVVMYYNRVKKRGEIIDKRLDFI